MKKQPWRWRLKNPIGTHLKAWDKDGFIIGVVKDAKFKSLKDPIRPMIFHLTNNFADDVMNLFGVIYISIKPEEVPKTVQVIKSTWEKFNPGYPFEYYFLDETYNNLYQSEERLADIFGVFTSLALLVTILGLFGLALFMTEHTDERNWNKKSFRCIFNKHPFTFVRQFYKVVDHCEHYCMAGSMVCND